MTKGKVLIHVPARRVGEILPRTLAVGSAMLEMAAERTSNGGSHARRFAARFSNGSWTGDAHIDIKPVSKTATELAVAIEPAAGLRRLLALPGRRAKLGNLFAQALGYEIETRNIEEADAFEVRRTTPELVKARSA